MRSRTAVMFSLSVLVLLACQGPEGPMGPAGPQGPPEETGSAGEAGPQGEAGPLDYLLVSAVSIIPESEELETPTLAVAEGALLLELEAPGGTPALMTRVLITREGGGHSAKGPILRAFDGRNLRDRHGVTCYSGSQLLAEGGRTSEDLIAYHHKIDFRHILTRRLDLTEGVSPLQGRIQ